MTAMIGGIENDVVHDHDVDHDENDDDDNSISEMFRSTSGLLDSLDKLTNEIKANLMSDDEAGSGNGSTNETTSSNEDDDFYWEDGDKNYYSEDDDPDSGENKLYSMMDDLVQELMVELKHDRIDEDCKDDRSEVDEESNERTTNNGEQTCTTETVNEVTKVDSQIGTKSNDSVPPVLACASADDGASTTSNLKASQSADDREERHVKLRQHVQTLLIQVAELSNSMNSRKRKSIKNEYNEKISANIQKKIEQGDVDADRVEHLVGTIATYSKFKEANTNAISSLSSPQTPQSAVKNSAKKKGRRKRTNKHKRRKSKSFVQTQQSLQILSDSLMALDEKLARENAPRH